MRATVVVWVAEAAVPVIVTVTGPPRVAVPLAVRVSVELPPAVHRGRAERGRHAGRQAARREGDRLGGARDEGRADRASRPRRPGRPRGSVGLALMLKLFVTGPAGVKTDVVPERVGGIGRVVVVVAGQGEGDAVAGRCGQVRADLDPGPGVRAGAGKQGRGGARDVVAQGGRRPVVGDGVGTGTRVPEGQRAAAACDREGLADRAVAGRGDRASRPARRTCPCGPGSSRSRSCRSWPSPQRARLEAAVDDRVRDREP